LTLVTRKTADATNEDNVNAARVVDSPAPAPARDAEIHIVNKRNTQIFANFKASCSTVPPFLKKVAKKQRNKSPRPSRQ